MAPLFCSLCEIQWRRRHNLDSPQRILTWHFLTLLRRQKRGLQEYRAECSVCGHQCHEYLPPGLNAVKHPKPSQ